MRERKEKKKTKDKSSRSSLYHRDESIVFRTMNDGGRESRAQRKE